MKSGAISIFLVIFSALMGVYVARELFPKIVQKEIIRTVLEEATPEIIERVQYDTTFITKWKTRILYKTLTPRSVIEIPHVEIDSLAWAILALDYRGSDLSVDVYNVGSKQLTVASYYIENDFKLRIAQGRLNDPLILLESRNLFDLTPHFYLGYNSRSGPVIELRDQRLWKLHLAWSADRDGLHATGYVKLQ